jgi:hypothetical protein
MLLFLNSMLVRFTNILTSPIGYLVSIFAFEYIKISVYIINTFVIAIGTMLKLLKFTGLSVPEILFIKSIPYTMALYIQYMCYCYNHMYPNIVYFINYVSITIIMSHFQQVWSEKIKESQSSNSYNILKARQLFENIHNYLAMMALFPYVLLTIKWIFKY